MGMHMWRSCLQPPSTPPRPMIFFSVSAHQLAPAVAGSDMSNPDHVQPGPIAPFVHYRRSAKTGSASDDAGASPVQRAIPVAEAVVDSLALHHAQQHRQQRGQHVRFSVQKNFSVLHPKVIIILAGCTCAFRIPLISSNRTVRPTALSPSGPGEWRGLAA